MKLDELASAPLSGPSIASQTEAEAISSRRNLLGSIVRYILYALLIFIFIVPFLWMLFGSLRNEAEIFAYLYPFSWKTIFPIEWTLESYLDIFG
ncbi:MAG: hypothetical protein KDE47_32055, partial [Caldilineaceae bacterium]|nr:hypothetical protein [Caldilineaceae bacterium]